MTPTGITTYSARVAYPSLLVLARDTPVQLPIYYEGELVVPTSGTYQLLAIGGASVVSAAVSIVSSIATYTIPAASLANSLPLGEGYIEVWLLSFAGESAPREFRRTAALAKCMLFPTVTDLDLIAEYDALADQRVGRMASFQGPIEQAWKQVITRLIQEGRLPYMIRTPDALRDAHFHLSLAKLFQSFGLNADGSHWRELAKEEQSRYEKAWSAASVQLDQDQDGLVDNPLARASATGVVSLNGGQPRTMFRNTYRRYGL
jgi:hypothetical protein